MRSRSRWHPSRASSTSTTIRWCSRTPPRCSTALRRAPPTTIDADLRAPDKILQTAADTLDFTQPVALMLLGILAHITDDDEAYAIVRQLLEALPSGSYLVVCDDTNVILPGARTATTVDHVRVKSDVSPQPWLAVQNLSRLRMRATSPSCSR